MTSPDTLFTAVETHGRALRPENELVAHSQDVGWRSLHAAIFKEAPLHVTESALDHPFIIYHITHPCEVTRRIEGARRETGLLGPRNICVTPPEAVTEWEHHGHPEILQVYLRRSLYEASVSELYGCDATAAEIVPRFGIVDPLLEQLAIALGEALHRGQSRTAVDARRDGVAGGDQPVVALSVGFSSQSHLSHWMIRQAGVSPGVYRRNA